MKFSARYHSCRHSAFIHACVGMAASTPSMPVYLLPDSLHPPGCSALIANTAGTSGERSGQNCRIMGHMHLNQVRQIAYRGVGVGVGVGTSLQQQAVGDLWHSNSTALHGHGGSGRGITLWNYSC